MKKFLRWVLLLSLLPAGCAGTGKINVPADALAVPEQTALYQFGEVFQGERIHANFLIGNPAPYRIEIDQIDNQCGCTTSLLTDQALNPGEQVLLMVELNTDRLWGPQSKTVVLHTNDPGRLHIRLVLEGVVREVLPCEPRRINLLTDETAPQVTVRLKNARGRRITISRIDLEDQTHITARPAAGSLPCPLAPGEEISLIVQAELKHPGARLSGTISMFLEGETAVAQIPYSFERRREAKKSPARRY